MSLSMAGATAIGAGVQGIGIATGMGQGRKQYHRNKKLMRFQKQHQMDLNQHGHDLQMDMWNKTNYKAQMEHMKAAGLNPALMYGMGGGGGTTAGSQGGGSAQGGSVDQARAMDISNIMAMAQIAKLDAETKDTQSTTRKRDEVETELDKQRIKNLIVEADSTEEKTRLIKVQRKLEGVELMHRSDQILATIGKITQEEANLRQQYNLTEEQWEGLVNESIGTGLSALNNAELINARTKLTTTEEQAVWEKLDIAYNKLALEGLAVEGQLTSADAQKLKSVVEEELRPLELKQKKWEMWVRLASDLITSIIGAVKPKGGGITINN